MRFLAGSATVFMRLQGSTPVRFVIVGLTGAIVDSTVLYTLTEYAEVQYLRSAAAAFVLSYWVSFHFQRSWTFRNKSRRRVSQHLGLHFTLQLVNLSLNTAILYVLVEYAEMWYMIAQWVTWGIIAVWTFIATRWIFSH